MIETFRDIIDLWDSRIAMAQDVDVESYVVRTWYSRDSIPAEHWKPVIHFANYRGYGKGKVTADLLLSISAKKSNRRNKSKNTRP